jgi:hypothetical protein
VTRPSPLFLALGDVCAFTAFGVIGLISHEKSFAVAPVVRSIVPFAVAWLAIAPWLGAFSEEKVGGSGRGPDPRLGRIAAIWLPVGVLALVARAAIFDRHLLNAFFVIALVGHGLFLVGWRAIYARWVAPAAVQTQL